MMVFAFDRRARQAATAAPDTPAAPAPAAPTTSSPTPAAEAANDVGQSLGPFGAVRAAILYHYAPFDRTLWGRMRSVPCVCLLCIASWPDWGVRTAFFTLLLTLILIADPDEYQLMQFIME